METLTEKFNQNTINTINILSNLTFDIQRKNLATVFIEYAGHCNILHIRIFKGKWDKENMNIDQINNINIDFINLVDNYNPERIALIIEYLQNCLIANEILIPSKQLFKHY
jgi:hypothetical protein